MTDQTPDDSTRRVIRVPGEARPTRAIDDGDTGVDEGLVAPADLGSASRSCLAIIIVLLIIALLICAFLVLQPFLD
jgi:hypothetical protein